MKFSKAALYLAKRDYINPFETQRNLLTRWSLDKAEKGGTVMSIDVSHLGLRAVCYGIIACLLLLSACAPIPPPTFVEIRDTTTMGWKSIELRDGLNYEEAWQTLVDTVAIKYDIETMDKDGGYLRSAWQYITGKDQGTGQPFTYGRRLSCKFSPDKKTIQVKTEAYYDVRGAHISYGMDSAFNQDVFTSIAGKLGRTTR